MSLHPRVKDLPQVDGQPRRSLTCVNARFEDKAVFDLLVAWWRLQGQRSLTHWDAFSVLLDAALNDPGLDVPAELRRRRRS